MVLEARIKHNQKLSKNSHVTYFNKVHDVLKQSFKDGIITKNPALEVEGIKEAGTKREFLILDELKKQQRPKVKFLFSKKLSFSVVLQGFGFLILKS